MYSYGHSTPDATYTSTTVSQFNTIPQIKLKGNWKLFSKPLEGPVYVSNLGFFYLFIYKYNIITTNWPKVDVR